MGIGPQAAGGRAFARRKIIQPQTVDLGGIIDRLEPMLRRLIGEDVELTVIGAAQSLPVHVDVGSIEQVIMNLVVNARDAMPTGGRITVETARVVLGRDYVEQHPEVEAGEHVLLGVSDTGIGMSREVVERVFEPFFTTKGPGRGTGLGLAMCHGIIKQARGHIWVYSEEGRGTVFKVYLPAAEQPVGARRRSATVDDVAGGDATIVYVEDEPAVRATTKLLIESLGYRTFVAEGGEEALALAAELGAVDLLMTDVVMRGMGGVELAKRFTERFPGVKVLFSSGYTNNAIVHHGVLAEGTHFLQKPYSRRALAAALREALGEDPDHA